MARRGGAVHVATIKRRYKDREYVTHLLRRTYREDGKVKHETLGNLSHLPAEVVELVRGALRGERYLPAHEAVALERSLPHGAAAAVLGTLRGLALEPVLGPAGRARDLVVAMICQRLVAPGSKLSATRQFPLTTLGQELAVAGASEAELYGALDWLLARQGRIERQLAARHLAPGGFVLYDLTSTYLEGRCCPLAALGHSRDGKPGTLQVTFGLICSPEGRPVAVEVHPGGVLDHQTLPQALAAVSERFGVGRAVFCIDRGMVTQANIAALRERGLGFVTALRAPQVAQLARAGDLQLSLLDEASLAVVECEAFPAERLVVCRNPHLAAERARKREELLAATERELERVRAMVEGPRGRLKGAPAGQIGTRAGRVVNRYKVAKHFILSIADGAFAFARKTEQIVQEAALDGIYVLRTSVSEAELAAPAVVEAYKQLARAERSFRGMKGPDIEVRPVFHRLAERVRAHVLLCMLAYYVRFEMERRLAPLLFRDEHPPTRLDPVAPAVRSAPALAKAGRRRTEDDLVVHGFSDLLAALGTLTRNTLRLAGGQSFEQLSQATPLQARALALLEVNPNRL